MTSTRPRRLLLPESAPPQSPPEVRSSPRRSARNQESPVVNYSSSSSYSAAPAPADSSSRSSRPAFKTRPAPARRVTPIRSRSRSRSRTRSRSRSNSRARLFHGAGVSLSSAPLFVGARAGGQGLDFQSDDEDEQARQISQSRPRRESGQFTRWSRVAGASWMKWPRRLQAEICETVHARLLPAKQSKLYHQLKVVVSSDEVRWLVLSLLFLLLLAVGYRIKAALSSTDEKAVVIFAWLLAPLRQLVEGSRLATRALHDLLPWAEEGGGGGGGLRYSQEEGGGLIDYDALVTRILSHDRFHAILEKLAGEQARELEARMEDEVKRLEQRLEQRSSQLQLLANQTRAELQEQLSQVISLKEELAAVAAVARSGGQSDGEEEEEGGLGRKISELEAQLVAFRDQLAAIGTQQQQPPSSPLPQTGPDTESALAAVTDLKSKVASIGEVVRTVASEVKACCSRASDIPLVVHSAIDDYFSSTEGAARAASHLAGHLVTRPELAAAGDSWRADLQQQQQLASSNLEQLVRDEVEAQLAHQQQQQQQHPQGFEERSSQDVQTIVREALAKYDADKTGLFDFALESAGGSILSTRCTENYELSSAVVSVFGVPFWWETNNPRTILQPGSAPGQCWAFKGSHGSVVVRLSAEILVQAVSIEHISRLSTPDGKLSSAPKNLSISGVRGDEIVPLANFTYDITSQQPVQTFRFNGGDQGFNTVELGILSNHGHPDYTCLYRLRVHGTLVDTARLH